MKRIVCLLLLATLAFMGGASLPSWSQNPVVVELFTSEGCSSCPPADALLGELSHNGPKGVDLVLLGEHVDYWNYAGWTDRFSSAVFSERQNDYGKWLHLASVYTPQMVIDGHLQLVGSNTSDVYRDIEAAARNAKPAKVSLQWTDATRFHVSVQGPPTPAFRVLLAVTEDGLSTSVKGGENGGRILRHAAVVRQLRQLGVTSNGHFETTADVSPQAEWNRAQLKVAVLVQDAATGRIMGAASTHFAHNEAGNLISSGALK